MFKKLLTSLIFTIFMVSAAFAVTYNDTKLEELRSKKTGHGNDYNDLAAFSINYSGDFDTCTVTITDGQIAMVAGTDSFLYDLTDSASDTMGEIIDLINSTNSAVFTCTEVDMLRSDDADLCLNASSSNEAINLSDYTVLYDTGGATEVGMQTPLVGLGIICTDADEVITVDAITANKNVAGYIDVYERDTDGTETLIWTIGIADDTALNVLPLSMLGQIEGAPGSDIIIRGDGTTAQASGNYVAVLYHQWKK